MAVKVTISNIKAGQVVSAGYRYRGTNSMDNNRFIGFKVGDLYFSKLQDLKEYYGVSNLRQLELKVEEDCLQVSVTAEFQNVSSADPYLWGAYLWEGCFRVGTSADRLTLAPAS